MIIVIPGIHELRIGTYGIIRADEAVHDVEPAIIVAVVRSTSNDCYIVCLIRQIVTELHVLRCIADVIQCLRAFHECVVVTRCIVRTPEHYCRIEPCRAVSDEIINDVFTDYGIDAHPHA